MRRQTESELAVTSGQTSFPKGHEGRPDALRGAYRLYPVTKSQLTTLQVSRRLGITPRLLRWWVKHGLVSAQRQGKRQLYRVNDVAEIAVICALRRKEFPIERVRGIINFLRKELKALLVLDETAESAWLEVDEKGMNKKSEIELKILLVDAVGDVKSKLSLALGETPKLLEKCSSGQTDINGVQFATRDAQVAPNSILSPDDRLLNRYHRLADKRLNGALSGRDEEELCKIEEFLQKFEDAATSEFDRRIERRHETMMRQLKELTTELQKLRLGGSSPSKIQ